jgi:hypothetical protein
MAPRSLWQFSLRRFRFALATLALRLRFLTGKASFVEADVQMTTNQVSDVYDAPGRKPERRLLAHYQLKTRKPRLGREGWRLFCERVGDQGTHRMVALSCGFCGHVFVIQILRAIDLLASEATGGRPAALPASYGSDWFKFMNPDYEGVPSLYCLHCEQNGAPRVKLLATENWGHA